MGTTSLKLKQARAVLKVHPNDLQNLVQFGVVKLKRAEGTYVFGAKALLTAKMAFCLKESLGTGTNVLVKLIGVFQESEKQLKAANPKYVVFTCRFSDGDEPVKLASRSALSKSKSSKVWEGRNYSVIFREVVSAQGGVRLVAQYGPLDQ